MPDERPIGYITVPVYTLPEGHFTGFRQSMLTLADGEGFIGGVSTGAGLGTDSVWLERPSGEGKAYAQVCGRDLLAAYFGMVAPEKFDSMPMTNGFPQRALHARRAAPRKKRRLRR